MKLYHATTEKKAKRYRENGRIISPVRGFTTLMAAMCWAMKVGRTVVYEVDCPDDRTHRLPDHHNDYGEAFYCQDDVGISDIKCVISGTTQKWSS